MLCTKSILIFERAFWNAFSARLYIFISLGTSQLTCIPVSTVDVLLGTLSKSTQNLQQHGSLQELPYKNQNDSLGRQYYTLIICLNQPCNYCSKITFRWQNDLIQIRKIQRLNMRSKEQPTVSKLCIFCYALCDISFSWNGKIDTGARNLQQET